MQIVRTIVWVALLVLLIAFSFFNWRPVEVQIWDNLVLETKIPALVIVAFLLGLVPMWLIHRASKWRLQRRIVTLENAARAQAVAPAPAPMPPVAEPIAPEPVAGAPVPRNEILG
jgi:putative membrane protein